MQMYVSDFRHHCYEATATSLNLKKNTQMSCFHYVKHLFLRLGFHWSFCICFLVVHRPWIVQNLQNLLDWWLFHM